MEWSYSKMARKCCSIYSLYTLSEEVCALKTFNLLKKGSSGEICPVSEHLSNS